MLRLIRASKSRPSGTWSDDDYDVFEGEQHIGRIVWSYAAQRERPWVSDRCRAGSEKKRYEHAECHTGQKQKPI